jgi:uncharacterized protein (TIGR03083 family)
VTDTDAGSGTAVGVDEILAALHRSHVRFVQLLAPLSDDEVTDPSYADGWDIAQVASHLGSGAEIFGLFLDAGRRDTQAPGGEQFSLIWARWNAKPAVEQIRDAVRADARFLHAVDALPDPDRSRWQLDMFGSRQNLAALLRMRLGEHALHTWDIAVALDPCATVHDAALVLDSLPRITEHAGKPTGDTLTVSIETDLPARRFRIDLRADAIRLTPADPSTAPAQLRVPAEALVRLVYGRLDADHTPATVRSDNVELDTLRRAFPGL